MSEEEIEDFIEIIEVLLKYIPLDKIPKIRAELAEEMIGWFDEHYLEWINEMYPEFNN